MAPPAASSESGRPTRGSCLCGGITYEYDGKLELVVNCHCVDCRKTQGATFATNGSVKAEHFRLLSGESLLRGYEATPGTQRCFCSRCSSPIFKRLAQPNPIVRIRMGTLDDDPGVGPVAHIWTSQAVPWEAFYQGLPRFAKAPGG